MSVIILFAVQIAFSQEQKTIEGGIINGRATHFPEPVYSQNAKNACADGLVKVDVLINEKGRVVSAQAISGNDLLRDSAVEAAKKAKFRQTEGSIPVKVRGTLVYNFDSFSKCIKLGIVNKKALSIPKPSLPHGGHPSHLRLEKDEIVIVQIVVNMDGKVIYAKAFSGHPILRKSSEKAALESKFVPTNEKVKLLITYNFAKVDEQSVKLSEIEVKNMKDIKINK